MFDLYTQSFFYESASIVIILFDLIKKIYMDIDIFHRWSHLELASSEIGMYHWGFIYLFIYGFIYWLIPSFLYFFIRPFIKLNMII